MRTRLIRILIIMMTGMQLTAQAGNYAMLNNSIYQKYQLLDSQGEKPDYELFKKGIVGYLNMKSKGQITGNSVITLIDFRLSSNEKRLWVVDLVMNKVIFHSLVAHGKNTGMEFAEEFSNEINSKQSSLGFYITRNIYLGKHGYSLRLDGMEAGFNDNAYERAVVMHSADYVDDGFAQENGRIGRSFGCPAIPVKGHKEVIRTIADGTCMFIYFPKKQYLESSLLQDEEVAEEFLHHTSNPW